MQTGGETVFCPLPAVLMRIFSRRNHSRIPSARDAACTHGLVHQGCHNEVPPIMYIRTTEIYSLTVPEGGRLSSRCSQGWCLSEAQRERLFHACPRASGGCWQFSVLVDWQPHHSSLCLCLHQASSRRVSTFLSSRCFLIRPPALDLRSPITQYDLIVNDSPCL